MSVGLRAGTTRRMTVVSLGAVRSVEIRGRSRDHFRLR